MKNILKNRCISSVVLKIFHPNNIYFLNLLNKSKKMLGYIRVTFFKYIPGVNVSLHFLKA